MTEDEARTRWCPFSRVRQLHGGVAASSINRIDLDEYPIPAACRCLASACMAWRWHQSDTFKYEADMKFRATGVRITPTEGYCGLAGTFS